MPLVLLKDNGSNVRVRHSHRSHVATEKFPEDMYDDCLSKTGRQHENLKTNTFEMIFSEF